MKRTFFLVLTLLSVIPFLVFSQNVSNVLQHGDQRGTGWNDREIKLTTSNVNTSSFGKLFTLPVDDQVYAQPLIVANRTIGGQTRNVLFAATTNNTVYAFDADKVGSPLWQKNYTPVGQRPPTNMDMRRLGACGGNYNDFGRPDGSPATMGIVGTPVIDTLTNTMYFATRNTNGTTYQQFFHAIDIFSGNEKSGSPVLITATVSGTGDGSVGGKLTFNAATQNQRPGLVLSKGIVYLAWASHCDQGPYHGWIIGYDANTLQQKIVYNTTPDGYNGGIWMSAGAPTIDEFGNLYVCTGNGSVGTNGNPRARGESIIKLVPNLTTKTLDQATYFTPSNYQALEVADLDFGVLVPLLIPGTTQAFTGCKDGNLYLVDRNNMGGFNATTNNVLQTIKLGSGKTLRSSFAYYKSNTKEFVYTWSENAALKAFPYLRTTNRLDAVNPITSGIQGPNSANNGVFMSVSSNGTQNGTAILWASHAANGDANQSVRPGILRAIDANDVTKELWNSNQLANDNISNYAKFVCPVIANGKVYMATFSNQLVIYGLRDNPTGSCTGTVNLALQKPAQSSSEENTTYVAAKAFDGNMTTRWSSKQGLDPQWIYVNLGAKYNICKVNLTWEVALAKNFQIQVSDDAINWTTISTITGNTSLSNSLFVTGTGQYVRMYGTARGTTFGYSLYNFEVYGTTTNSCTAPSNLSLANITPNGALLKWDLVNGVSNYNVKYKTVNAANYTTATATTNSLALTTLACGTDYLFKVQAACSATSLSDFSIDKGFSTGACNANCGILPTRWSQQDIGAIGVSGQACYNNEIWNIQASGSDIGGTNDQFHFAYKTFTGDGNVSAKVETIDKVNPANKAGIMFRENTNPDARNAFIAFTSANEIIFQYRATTGGQTNSVNLTGLTLPYYIKMIKVGTKYSGYVSKDGLKWQQLGTMVDLGFGASTTCNAGLATTSHDNTKLSTSTFSNVPIIFSSETNPNPGVCPTTNQALNRPAGSSGNLSTDKSIYELQAFDGNATTRWASKIGSDNAHIFVDLGKKVNICRVSISWAAQYAKNYQIQVSDDALNWTTVSTVTGNTALQNDLNVSGTGRFVRMLATLRGTTLGYSIYEMGVYGTAVPGQPANIALNKPAFASTSESTAYQPKYAVDGNGPTRWASAATDTQWMYIDLGATYSLSTIVLDWETALAANYQIQVSTNAINWTTIKTVTGNTQYANVLSVTGTGRYVRMLGTKRGFTAGYSLYEFEVYGVPAPATARIGLNIEKSSNAEILEDNSLFTLFPNPANDKLTVNYTLQKEAEINFKIADMMGKSIKDLRIDGKAGTHSHTIDVVEIPIGIYILRAESEGEFQSKKFIIIR